MDRGADMARLRRDPDRAERVAQGGRRAEGRDPRQGCRLAGPVPPALRQRGARRFAPADPDPRLPAARRRTGPDHGARHRRRADRGRAGPALQGRHDRHRVRGQGRDVHHLLVLAGHRARHDRRAGTCQGPVPEAARLRRAAPALRRGDRRRHRRAPGQLPPGLHPPGADRRRRPPDRRSPPGRRRRSSLGTAAMAAHPRTVSSWWAADSAACPPPACWPAPDTSISR